MVLPELRTDDAQPAPAVRTNAGTVAVSRTNMVPVQPITATWYCYVVLLRVLVQQPEAGTARCRTLRDQTKSSGTVLYPV